MSALRTIGGGLLCASFAGLGTVIGAFAGLETVRPPKGRASQTEIVESLVAGVMSGAILGSATGALLGFVSDSAINAAFGPEKTEVAQKKRLPRDVRFP
jgi:hypothetical protein